MPALHLPRRHLSLITALSASLVLAAVADAQPPVVPSEPISVTARLFAAPSLSQPLPASVTAARCAAPDSAAPQLTPQAPLRLIAQTPEPIPSVVADHAALRLIAPPVPEPLPAASPPSSTGPWSAWFGPCAGEFIARELARAGQRPLLASEVLGRQPNPAAPGGGAPESAARVSPAPLSSDASACFREAAASAGGDLPTASPAILPRRSTIAARLPQGKSMFSFDTTDKVSGPSRISPLQADATADLSIELRSPDRVDVGQIFQQFVELRNDGERPLRDLGVTQVGDLSALGLDQPQSITIECLAPGETKTVVFAARSLRTGELQLRYVARCAAAHGTVGDRVRVTATEAMVGASESANEHPVPASSASFLQRP